MAAKDSRLSDKLARDKNLSELRASLLLAGRQALHGLESIKHEMAQEQKRIERDIQRGSRLSSGRIPY